MKKKLFVLTAILGITALASSVPNAEAIGYCSTSYCAGKSADTPCACPPGTDRVGQRTFCGAAGSNWSNCWYV
jgi:hypothetical protein